VGDAAVGAALAPHVPFLPIWQRCWLVAAGAWRWAADRRRWRSRQMLRVIAVAATTLAGAGSYRTLTASRPARCS